MPIGKLLFLIVLFLNSFLPSVIASHLVIGELSYKKIGTSDYYEITVTYYRDCRPASQGGGNPAALMSDNPVNISIFQGSNLYLFDSVQVTSSENLSFPGDCRLQTTPVQCISKYEFKTTVKLPQSSLPYTIVNQRCCLNETIENVVSPGNKGYSFVAVIPPSISNNSAVFKPMNSNIICLHDHVSIDHSAIDPDGDSLSYELCEMYLGGDANNPKPITTTLPTFFPIPYKSGYDFAHPMDFAQIHPTSGLLTLQAQQLGHFMISVCCHEWRNGVQINTTRRAFVYQVNDCNIHFNADINCDPYIMDFSNGNICYANCNTDLTVAFQNQSLGNGDFYWDFGIDSIQNDTSTQRSPVYQYPHAGNYFVTLISTLANCSDTAGKWIYVGTDSIQADFSTNQNLCTGAPINLHDLSISLNDSIRLVKWYIHDRQSESTLSGKDTVVTLYTPGDIHITNAAYNSHGCYDTLTQMVWLSSPNVKAYEDMMVPKGTSISLYASGANTYSWIRNGVNEIISGQNDPILIPSTEYAGLTHFIVSGTDMMGCIGRDTVKVFVTNEAQFIIPTAFTPNADGQNDFLHAIHSGYSLKVFKVFNRWGQEVFKTNDIEFKWSGDFNGKPLSMDTYYWMADVVDMGGLKSVFKGDFMIIH